MSGMKVWHKEFTFTTGGRREIVDITREVVRAVKESGIRNGIVVVQLPHATASLVLNEAEGGLERDILDQLDRMVPVRGGYLHDRIDDNAHAHIKSAIIGSSRVLPVVDGEIARGTWQNFLVIEEDGPRTRRCIVTVLGE